MLVSFKESFLNYPFHTVNLFDTWCQQPFIVDLCKCVIYLKVTAARDTRSRTSALHTHARTHKDMTWIAYTQPSSYHEVTWSHHLICLTLEFNIVRCFNNHYLFLEHEIFILTRCVISMWLLEMWGVGQISIFILALCWECISVHLFMVGSKIPCFNGLEEVEAFHFHQFCPNGHHSFLFF